MMNAPTGNHPNTTSSRRRAFAGGAVALVLVICALGVASTRHGHEVESGEVVTYCKTDGPLHAEFSTIEPLDRVVDDPRSWSKCERTYYGF